uniref:DASH complex subunit DUO1 n=1 Tax=Moniliophthora roreri TaxID=221103 RepID=A0A0W0FHC0_MONRR
MNAGDFSDDIHIPSTSRLMSESPMLQGSGSAEPDLSISALSLSDRTAIPEKPFSLLARPHGKDPEESRVFEDVEDAEAEGNEVSEEDRVKTQRLAAKHREEKLERDLYVLKKLNSAFMAFNKTLDDVGTANQQVTEQLKHTERLLNKYMNILVKSERMTQVIFDEEFEGGEADLGYLEREREEAAERARKEAERRELEAQRERERKAREAQERTEQEARERAERERRLSQRGAVRGVRGTRASMRSARGATTTARAGRGAALPARSTSTTRRQSGIARGTVKRT